MRCRRVVLRLNDIIEGAFYDRSFDGGFLGSQSLECLSIKQPRALSHFSAYFCTFAGGVLQFFKAQGRRLKNTPFYSPYRISATTIQVISHLALGSAECWPDSEYSVKP